MTTTDLSQMTQVWVGYGIQKILLGQNLSASLTYFWGQLFLPIPFSTSVTTVVGTPIPVVSPINDTEDAMLHAVEKMHAEFITSIKDLYRLHAADCGYGDKPLEIL